MSTTSEEKHAGALDSDNNNIAEPASHDSSISEEKGALDEANKGVVALIMVALSIRLRQILNFKMNVELTWATLAVFLSALDVTIITTALPTIAEHFHSSAGYTWIGSAYLLASAASTPVWGKVSDIFGRKPILLLANFVFFVGSLVAALSINIGMLITARAIQGIGGGGLLVIVDVLICDLFSMRTRGSYLGVIGGTWAFACAVGPIIGGAFTEKVSWRWCFYINLPLDGLAFIIILLFLKVDTPRTPIIAGLRAIDWAGTFAIVGGTLLFLFGLQYGGVTFPWGSATVICLLVFGIVLCFAFVLIEWKFAKYPIIPLRIFKTRSNSAALISTFFHGLAFIGPFYYLPLFFQSVRSATPLLSGVYILPIALGLGFSAIATGAFIGITGSYRPPILIGWTLMVLGFGLLIDLDAHSGWAKLIIYQIIAGVGTGPIFQGPLVALTAQIAQSDVATATATFNFLRTLATAIGVIVGQVVYQNQLVSAQPQLIAGLGPSLAAQVGGASAGSNTQIIDSLPGAQRDLVHEIYAKALQPAWIMYTCFAAAGLISALFIRQVTLSSEHTVAKTGLAAEEEYAAQRKAEKDAKALKKNGSQV